MSPLISVRSLTEALAEPDPPVLLDVRWRLGGPPGIDFYRAGHLPSAVFVDLDRELAGPPGRGGRHPLPDAGEFQAAMRRAGVCDGLPVVCYDDTDMTAASRAWWLLRYFGHRDVRVLDGGLRAWHAAGRPLSTAGSEAEPGDFTARPGHMELVDAAGAAGIARSGKLLDARTAERYRGENEPVDPVAGHIPGAISAPAAGNLAEDGSLRDPAALRERFAGTGMTADHGDHGDPVGAYCGSGVAAAAEVLALEVAGIPAALYVGSWSEWVTDPARPVATGPDPG